MMKDIEERLREYASFITPAHVGQMLAEAADVIHTLRWEDMQKDKVQVVRCKDCNWSYAFEHHDGRWCGYHLGMMLVDDNGFCDHGRRRCEDAID